MNVHFTYKLSKTPDVEQSLQQQVEKLNRRLQVFKPDMVALRGALEEAPRSGYAVSLNLRLPAGQMAARSSSDTIAGAIKSSFDDLTEQLTRHKDQLRRTHKWPRVRGVQQERAESQVPFEQTVAAVPLEKITAEDVNGWVNANLGRLQRYIQRELMYRRHQGQRHFYGITSAEVLDEVIANALDDHKARPEKLALEHWLYRLARSAMDRLANQARQQGGALPLESEQRKTISEFDDDSFAQVNPRDDEELTNENIVADRRVSTPEELAASYEVVGMVEMALRNSAPLDRESFLLATFEGFTQKEIAHITERTESEVHASIKRAREHLRKALPVGGRLREKLIENTKSA
ncbi:MAG TPA: sigma factor-like helix-turn-helix DNA-binding protein [candidate division Zixibacteria bacterium]|nr:sigma factor-like helix-turn-helix DNA-binding protein [candidate division Zixibacteria bacterium]